MHVQHFAKKGDRQLLQLFRGMASSPSLFYQQCITTAAAPFICIDCCVEVVICSSSHLQIRTKKKTSGRRG